MKWDATDVTMVLLGSTIPLCIIVIFMNRVLGGAPMSENASSIINTITTTIGGGLIAILAYKYGKKNDDGKFNEKEIDELIERILREREKTPEVSEENTQKK